MEEKKKRVIFSEEEKMILKCAVLQRKDKVENKRTDGGSLAQKARGWDEVTNDFNSHPNVTKRTTNQLKKGWENMKTRRKLELGAEKRERMKTGGGSYTSKIPDDPDMDSIGIDIEMATDAVDSDAVYTAGSYIPYEQEEVFVGTLDPRRLYGGSPDPNACQTPVDELEPEPEAADSNPCQTPVDESRPPTSTPDLEIPTACLTPVDGSRTSEAVLRRRRNILFIKYDQELHELKKEKMKLEIQEVKLKVEEAQLRISQLRTLAAREEEIHALRVEGMKEKK